MKRKTNEGSNKASVRENKQQHLDCEGIEEVDEDNIITCVPCDDTVRIKAETSELLNKLTSGY